MLQKEMLISSTQRTLLQEPHPISSSRCQKHTGNCKVGGGGAWEFSLARKTYSRC